MIHRFRRLRSVVRSLWRGLRRRADVEAEMREEFRHHIDLRTEHLLRSGLSPAEAGRRARIEFGSIETHRDAARAARGLRFLDQLRFSWLDVKLGVRMLRKYPVLTLVTGFALAIGIPVGLAPMHLANAIMAPLPVDEGDRIRVVRYIDPESTDYRTPTLRDFIQWRDGLTRFEALGATTSDGSAYNVVSGEGRVAPARGAEVTASTFEILRVPPLLGRPFTAADEAVGAPAVVVIGEDLWRSRLDGDPDIVGRTLRIDGVPHTVVGVMPDGFHFPSHSQLWLPLRVDALAAGTEGAGRPGMIFGRLRDGVEPDEAEAELATFVRHSREDSPEEHARLRAEVVPFGPGYFGFAKGGLLAEPGMFLFPLLSVVVLALACVNVGTLILARTATRSAELAVRAALGAGRVRIIGQLFAEAMVLAVLGAAAGLLAADRVTVPLQPLIERELPYWLDLGVTRETAAWGLALAVFSAAIIGVVPAIRATGKAIQSNIRRASMGPSGIRFGALSSVLIAADVAVAVPMVATVLTLSEGFRPGRTELSIPADRFLTAELTLPRLEPDEGAAALSQDAFGARLGEVQRELVRRLAAEPAVRSVAVGSSLPHMDHYDPQIEVEGEDRPAEFRGHEVETASVAVGFFEALGHPVLRGRGFRMADLEAGSSAIIVNTTFVQRVLGGRNAIGQRIRYVARGDNEPGPWYEIVGVVGDLGMRDVAPDADQGLYHVAAPGEIYPLHLAIRVNGDPASFTPRLRSLALAVEPAAIISNPLPLDQVRFANFDFMRWLTIACAVLAGVLLALAACGIYALMSLTVAQRTREIGIRVALGSQRRRVWLIIGRRSLLQIAAGMLPGIALSALLLSRFEYFGDDSPFGVALLVGVAVMVPVGLVACTVPTLRALRILPAEALKAEG